MKMKKITALCLTACFALVGFGCNVKPTEKVTVYMPDGAPAVALSKMMNDGYENTEFVVAASGDIVRARIADGTADMAILPVNASAALYNSGAKIKMLSVNTHGNLYIISKNKDGNTMELADFVGGRIAVFGQYDVPGLTLRMLLDEAEVPYVVSAEAVDGKLAVTYVDTGTTAISYLGQGAVDYALVPEPAATNGINKLNGEVECDIQAQWESVFGGGYPQACLVASNTVDDAYISKFMTALKASDGWAEQNPTAAVAAVRSHTERGTESTIADLTAAMISGCNIKTVSAADSKASCIAYFTALTKQEKPDGSAVLAKLPDDGFYYTAA